MRKILLLSIALLLVAFCLVGCGGRMSEVPDSIIENTCGSSEAFCRFDNYNSTTLDIISHAVDKEANTDYVSYEYGFDYACGSCIFYCENCFQYYKDSDTWACIGGTEPVFTRVDWDKDSIIGLYEADSDSKLFKKNNIDYSWTLEIQDFDYESNSIIVSYGIICDTELNKGYCYFTDGSDTSESFYWDDTESFYFDINNDGYIQFDIPCGLSIGSKDYDICLRVQVRPTGIWTAIVGW